MSDIGTAHSVAVSESFKLRGGETVTVNCLELDGYLEAVEFIRANKIELPPVKLSFDQISALSDPAEREAVAKANIEAVKAWVANFLEKQPALWKLLLKIATDIPAERVGKTKAPDIMKIIGVWIRLLDIESWGEPMEAFFSAIGGLVERFTKANVALQAKSKELAAAA